jgi:signal transduction histidine kinase
VDDTTRRRSTGRRPRTDARGVPLVPLAPLAVTCIALVAALSIAGVASDSMQRSSDELLELRAKTVAAALAARLRASPSEERSELLAQAAARSGTGYALIDESSGVVTVHGDAPRGADELRALARRTAGVAAQGSDRRAFAVRSLSEPLEHLALAAFVEAPSPAEGTRRMRDTVTVLTVLMLTVALGVALALVGATREDLRFIRKRIRDLAGPEEDTTGVGERAKALPLRSFDQVGTLTVALNNLVARFAKAERGYQSDLDAARQIDAERAQFLAGLSHELRTPLNAILGFAHLLESEGDAPLAPDAAEALAMIRSSGEHLKALIDDILDLSAAETGQLRLSRNVVEVCAVAEEVVREARAMVGTRDVAVLFERDEAALAWADSRRLRQVLGNLVSNALKATAAGEVRVTVAHEPTRQVVRITVSDTGRGIEPSALAAIFEPFKQVGDEATRRGGVGLGLAITKRLVQLHDGTIDARSELRVGSTFEVRLPDNTAATKVPRDSLVPWSDAPTGPEPARDVLPSLSNEITERRRALERR